MSGTEQKSRQKTLQSSKTKTKWSNFHIFFQCLHLLTTLQLDRIAKLLCCEKMNLYRKNGDIMWHNFVDVNLNILAKIIFLELPSNCGGFSPFYNFWKKSWNGNVHEPHNARCICILTSFFAISKLIDSFPKYSLEAVQWNEFSESPRKNCQKQYWKHVNKVITLSHFNFLSFSQCFYNFTRQKIFIAKRIVKS